jgi:hypothetical protein
MNDTSPEMSRMIAARYSAMSPFERMQIASSMFETARAIIASSLAAGLSREQRRYAIAKRLYGEELPELALRAHASYPD